MREYTVEPGGYVDMLFKRMKELGLKCYKCGGMNFKMHVVKDEYAEMICLNCGWPYCKKVK